MGLPLEPGGDLISSAWFLQRMSERRLRSKSHLSSTGVQGEAEEMTPTAAEETEKGGFWEGRPGSLWNFRQGQLRLMREFQVLPLSQFSWEEDLIWRHGRLQTV